MSVDQQVQDILADIRNLNGREEWEQKGLMTRIECAIRALPGQELKPDLGPWTVSPDGRLISSDNFEHDVQLKLTGDFYGNEARLAYAYKLIDRLNGAEALPKGLPEEPPPSLLYSMAMRYRHDFGLKKNPEDGPLSSGCTDEERRAILTTMRQLYEEVAGHGFYRWQ